MDTIGHRPALCILCRCEAHRFLSVGDLTLYLCPSHLDLCIECLAIAEEGIADNGNVCARCGGVESGAYAELAVYECYPGCPTCALLT